MSKLSLEVTAEELRTMLRIRHNKLDNELSNMKEAFLSDIELCGVRKIPEDPALTKACLRLFMRWQENYNGEAERYRAAYERTKIAMSLAQEYRE